MDIYSEPGTKVRFSNPTFGWDHDVETAKKHLTEGEVYTVKETEVHSYHTKVFLREFPGVAFNSVQFENI